MKIVEERTEELMELIKRGVEKKSISRSILNTFTKNISLLAIVAPESQIYKEAEQYLTTQLRPYL